jgi:Holliday junction resolvase RusA-like endonuclease
VIKLDIKPLTVNQAWQGKRFKTPKYNKYINDMMMILPKFEVVDEKMELHIIFGLSSKLADIDNPLKCFIDCLQKKYGFNDRNIYRLHVEKVDVKKGCEFIEFDMESLI